MTQEATNAAAQIVTLVKHMERAGLRGQQERLAQAVDLARPHANDAEFARDVVSRVRAAFPENKMWGLMGSVIIERAGAPAKAPIIQEPLTWQEKMKTDAGR